ncbi:hypothetical protein T4D_3610 [Trichinella pseudospiralis]|uniref:Uncharacterized protein n=1 Tax=Trichinella pseudospiralis TaxID=6337 RepID=A0A0V1FW53_TRIPS|nr:hypothetical protein T4D_3610 [Trichinella pseudospiralis]
MLSIIFSAYIITNGKIFNVLTCIFIAMAFMLVSDLRCPINNNYLQSKLRLIKVGDLKISK